MHAEASQSICRPVERVFEYVADPANLPEWSGAAVEVRDLRRRRPGESGEGDEFTPVHRFLGRRFEEHVEVTVYEPNRRVTNRSTGGLMPLEVGYRFEEIPEGTGLTVSVDARPTGFFGLIGPLFGRALERQLKKDLEALKDLLEAQSLPAHAQRRP